MATICLPKDEGPPLMTWSLYIFNYIGLFMHLYLLSCFFPNKVKIQFKSLFSVIIMNPLTPLVFYNCRSIHQVGFVSPFPSTWLILSAVSMSRSHLCWRTSQTLLSLAQDTLVLSCPFSAGVLYLVLQGGLRLPSIWWMNAPTFLRQGSVYIFNEIFEHSSYGSTSLI